ncbi:galactosyl transferase GMA12/MNN10 family protein [Macrophomina phaseolina]|uniref:Galactosyl transferase GMA12/MNN10 family protein n=1 Tax=Macrophomina phaseolina TaxID=35725 RepID=A0ABQ8GAK8_9PEZI|nr:galactosyl transferase GMA12/MNN10 family protein [Macrophomina phaseolina]
MTVVRQAVKLSCLGESLASFTDLTLRQKSPGARPARITESGCNGLRNISNVRIGKLTAHFGEPDPTYERALHTHHVHNRIHGIRPLTLREKLVDDLWNKPAFILTILVGEMMKPASERLEWLLWVDRDTVVMNPCIPVSAFLPPPPPPAASGHGDESSPEIHALVTKDWNGLNNGVFLVRVHAWSVELFTAIMAFRHYRPDVELRFTEQSAMELLLEEDRFRANAVYVPQRWFNAYQGRHNETLAPHQTRRGDFLVHFAGDGNRRENMAGWLEVAERHAPDWELDFWRTAYPEEIDAFWRDRKASQNSG